MKTFDGASTHTLPATFSLGKNPDRSKPVTSGQVSLVASLDVLIKGKCISLIGSNKEPDSYSSAAEENRAADIDRGDDSPYFFKVRVHVSLLPLLLS